MNMKPGDIVYWKSSDNWSPQPIGVVTASIEDNSIEVFWITSGYNTQMGNTFRVESARFQLWIYDIETCGKDA